MYESSGRTSFADYYRFFMLWRKKTGNVSSVLISLLFKLLMLYGIWLMIRIIRDRLMILVLVPMLLLLLFFIFPQAFPVPYGAILSTVASRKRSPSHDIYLHDRIICEKEYCREENYYGEIGEIVRIRDCFFLFVTDARGYIQSIKNLKGADTDSFATFISEKCSLPVRSFSSSLSYRKE